MVLLIVALGIALAMLPGGAQRPGARPAPTRRAVAPPPSPPPRRPPPAPTREPAAVPVDPRRAAATRLVDRGRAELQARRFAEAGEILERAVAVDPTCAAGYYQLARLHLEQGGPGLALAFLDKAAQVAVGDDTTLGEIFSLRGTVLEELGRTDEARAAYQRSLRLTPGDVRARVGLGRVGGELPDGGRQ